MVKLLRQLLASNNCSLFTKLLVDVDQGKRLFWFSSETGESYKMVLKYYFDLMSQPSRAVYLFLKANDIPFQACPVALRNGEHMTDEYGKLNPFRKVPVIDHNGFVLTESVAILRYLCSQYPIEDHWYPSDPKKRAKVDEYMAWQHTNIRIHGSMFFQSKIILKSGEKQVEKWRSSLDGTLSQMEDHLLGSKFVNGFDEITIADLLCACELEQPISAGYEMEKDHSKVQAYIHRVSTRLHPHYEEAHKFSRRLRDRVAQGKF